MNRTHALYPDLSIIIPVYNIADYLGQCLESAVGQTLDPSTYEIIVVDDKSTDSSLDIAHKYAKEYDQIRIISLPENSPGGAGFPYNIGLSQANGRYIGFIDGDDYVENNMFETLLRHARTSFADIAICSFKIAYGKEEAPTYDLANWKKIFDPSFKLLSKLEKKHVYLTLSPVPWRKIYKKTYLDKYNIRFPVGNFFYEDNPFHWFSLVHTDSIVCTDEVFVTHRMQRPGQTMSKNRRHIDMVLHVGIIKDYLVKNNLYESYKIILIDWVNQKLLGFESYLDDKEFKNLFLSMKNIFHS